MTNRKDQMIERYITFPLRVGDDTMNLRIQGRIRQYLFRKWVSNPPGRHASRRASIGVEPLLVGQNTELAGGKTLEEFSPLQPVSPVGMACVARGIAKGP
jgi:hypothetical protein